MSAWRLCPVVLVLALGAIPIAPPEHVHETTDEAGHVAFVAHRHAELHGIEVAPDAGRDTVDHPDPITIVPDATYTAPSVPSVPGPAMVTATVLPAPPARVVTPGIRAADRLIHAPPRAPSSLRAPPILPVV